MLSSAWVFMRKYKTQQAIGYILVLLFSTVLTACSLNTTPAPVRDAGSKRYVKPSFRSNTTPILRNETTRSLPVSSERPKLTPGTPYTVKAGDTLYAIAWMYGADVRALAEQNGLDATHHVRTGQVIHYSLPNRIPSPSKVVTTST